MALYDTVANIVSDAALELGLIKAAIADPFASTDQNILQLLALLKSAGRRLVGERDWSQLRFAVVSSLDGSVASLTLPDCARLVPGSLWNETTGQPFSGPITPAEWAWYWSSGVDPGPLPPYRQEGNTIQFVSEPDACQVDYACISRFFVSVDSLTFPATETPATAADVIWFDAPLMVCALKRAWKRAKGLDSTAEEQDYQDALAAAASSSETATPIRLSGPRLTGPIIPRTPETGWGL